MKRGFLNSSKAQARPLGPVIIGPNTSKPAVSEQDVSPLQVRSFPIGKVGKVDVPEIGALNIQERDNRLGSTPGALTYTRLPIDAEDDEPVTECIFFAGSKEIVINTPGFPQPLVHPAKPTFRLGTVPGKGVAVFSMRDLKMGDLILCERPLLISVRGVPTPENPNFTEEMFLQHTMNFFEKCVAFAVDRMRPKDKAAFMALANSHTEDGSGPCVGVIRTNGLGVSGLLPSKTDLPSNIYSATCKDISRLNHSCSPNTSTHFDKPSLSHRLYAVRDIPAGEELTFSYVDTENPTTERQKNLKPYGFVCTCSACTDPASDARRATIETSAPNVLLWATLDRTLPDDWIFTKAHQQLELLTIEKLEHHSRFADATRAVMEAYICLGDTENASVWAAKVHKQVWAGEYQHANIGSLLDPGNTAAYKAHPYWRTRIDPPNLVNQALQAFAKCAGPNNIKTLGGGYTMMMLNPLDMPAGFPTGLEFPEFEPPK
ncbi:Aldehyde dehydrogenase [Mycena sanguinolenta]|uniref:Aldehyde dehydrogenase n=1 Tax=Mycena sanguinolenta TaxID=230812 RepID=A0A8H6YFY4_9AGAR|nr:Aldehyde dehydrogenase [Mycena sanguinolenta]